MSKRSKDEVSTKILQLVDTTSKKTKRKRHDVPELPAEAVLPEPPADRTPWLRDYLNFSRKWSPRSPSTMHEVVALWVLSTAAAGRVTYGATDERAALYLLVVAPSGDYAKTKCTRIAFDLLDKANMRHLLLPNGSPQAQFKAMRLTVPKEWEELQLPHMEKEREDVFRRLGFKAQRGLLADEFGDNLAQMQNTSSYMSALARLLLQGYDSVATYESATIAHGIDARIDMPTLSLLGISTPAQLIKALAKSDKLWADGTIPRCAIATVGPDETRLRPSESRIPTTGYEFPSLLVESLVTMDKTLGRNEVEVQSHKTGEKKAGKDDVDFRAKITRWARYHVAFDNEFEAAALRYDDALFDIRDSGAVPEALKAAYVRMADRGKRIACLLAAIEGKQVATVEHWAKAQAIVERGRECLHWLYNELHYGNPEQAEPTETDRLLDYLTQNGPKTQREIQRYCWRLCPTMTKDAATLKRNLEAIAEGGGLHVGGTVKRPLYGVTPVQQPIAALTGGRGNGT